MNHRLLDYFDEEGGLVHRKELRSTKFKQEQYKNIKEHEDARLKVTKRKDASKGSRPKEEV
jgi:hypothetical protein